MAGRARWRLRRRAATPAQDGYPGVGWLSGPDDGYSGPGGYPGQSATPGMAATRGRRPAGPSAAIQARPYGSLPGQRLPAERLRTTAPPTAETGRPDDGYGDGGYGSYRSDGYSDPGYGRGQVSGPRLSGRARRRVRAAGPRSVGAPYGGRDPVPDRHSTEPLRPRRQRIATPEGSYPGVPARTGPVPRSLPPARPAVWPAGPVRRSSAPAASGPYGQPDPYAGPAIRGQRPVRRPDSRRSH